MVEPRIGCGAAHLVGRRDMAKRSILQSWSRAAAGRAVLPVLMACLVACGPRAAQPAATATSDAAQLEPVIRNYLLAHPEIIQLALATQTQRDAQAAQARYKAALDEHYDELTRDPESPVAGNPAGDVTIVEFLDYHCPHCREADPTIRALLKRDGNIRLVYRQFPILGPDSALAARAVLAATRQGRHDALHAALMNASTLDAATIDTLARRAGLDMQRFHADLASPDITRQLQRDYALAQSLGITGTPGFIIGHEVLAGAGDAGSIAALVALNRQLASAAGSASQAVRSIP